MALTTQQKIALFDLLECPYDGTVDQPTDDFNLVGQTFSVTNNDFSLQLKITARLAALSAEEEAVLVQHINQWLLIGSNVAMIDAGSVGGVNGVTYDPTVQLQ